MNKLEKRKVQLMVERVVSAASVFPEGSKERVVLDSVIAGLKMLMDGGLA
jgi:hypothetical protein